jgi:hypothetical protein
MLHYQPKQRFKTEPDQKNSDMVEFASGLKKMLKLETQR